MSDLEVVTPESLLNDDDKLKEEVKHLKDLLDQVYETSFIDDMIVDLKKANLREDEDQLIHLLILRQDIEKVLNVSMTKKSAEEVYKYTGMKIDRTLKHNGSSNLSKHYKEVKR